MLPNFDNDIQNPLLDSLRKKIEDKFGVDTSEISNEQLLFKHGQDLQNAGYTMTTMRDKLGDEFTDQYFDIKNRPQPDQGYLGEIGSGFKEQGYGLLGMPFQAAGLVAGATGDALGVDLGVEDYLMQKGSEIAAKGQEDPRTIQSIDDVRWDNPSEIARYLLGGIGASAPSVLESAAAFTGAGGVGYALAKSRAKKALAETIKNKGGATADERIKDVFQELVKQRAKQGFNTGAQVGLGISSIGLGVGEIYGELYQYTQLDPSDPEYVNPSTARALSTSFGTLAGGLDMMGAGKLLSRMTGMPETKAQDYFTRLLRALPEGIVIEGGTEVVQEILNLAAEKYAKGEELEFTDQEIMRMIDAGVLGAIGGTGFSAIGAIPGPKKKQEPEVGSQEIASESKEVQAQKELLANIKGESTEVRYKKGDKVQTAYGDKGVVRDSRAEDSTVEFADGTVRDVRNDRLAEALEPPPTEPTPVPEKTDQPQAESTEVVPEPIKEPVIPQHEEPSSDEVFVSVSGVNDNEVNVTPQTQEDIKKLLKHYRSWQKGDMYTMRGRAGKAGKGWDSSDFGRMEIKLGPDRALIVGKRGARNKAALKELGYLDNNGNWYKETPADREFVKDQERVLREGRLKVVDENKEWLAPGKKVKRVGTKLLGEIDKIDKDGFVVVGDERYNPIHLYPVREPKVRNLTPPGGGQGGGGAPSATDTSHLEFIASDLEVKGNDVEYFYKQRDGRISQTIKKLGQFEDLDALRTGLLEMLAKYKVQKRSAVVNALKIAIGKEEFRIDIDKDSGDYDFGAFEITQEEVDQAIIEAKRKKAEGNNKDSAPAQRTTLGNPIEVATGRAGGSDEQYPNSVFDENGDTPFDMFVGKIDIDDIVGEDGNVRRDTYDEENLDKISAGRNVDQISKSAALLILKNGKKLRIVSAGLTAGGQVRVYDSEHKGKALTRYIDVYAIEAKGWKVVGKLLTNKIGEHKKTGKKVRLSSPYIDVIYQSEKQFNEDDDLVKAMEQIDANEKDSKQAAQTKQIIKEKEEAKANNAELKKSIEETIAEIQRQLEEDDTQGSALPPEDQDGKPKATKEELLAQLEQLKQQLAYIEEQDKVNDIAIKTEQAKYQAIRKGEATQANAVREGVDGKPEGEGEGFTTSEAMLKNTKVGDVSKIWTSYLHTLSIARFEYILDFNKTVPAGGSKRAENRVKIFQSVGRASGAKEFFSLVTDMLGGAETGRKDLLKAYADSGSLFDKFLTALYQRLINDNATKAYVKNKEMVTDPMADPALAKKLRGLLERYFKGRRDVILKTVDAMAYDQARRGDDVDVFMQEPPSSPLEKVGLTAEAVKAMTGGKPTELTVLPDPEPDPEEETVVSKSDQVTATVQKLKKIIVDADLPLPSLREFTDAVKRVDIGSLVNLSPDELFQVVAEELVIQLNIRDEFKTQTELNDFAEVLQGRITEEEITLLFDKEDSKIGVADEQGLQLDEGYKLDHNNVDEGRLNPNRSRIPIIDPTTGQREITQTGTTSIEAIEHSLEEARRDSRRYMAPLENPVSKHPGRVEEAQAAMRRFAPLEGAPFTAKTAINQIINQFPHLGYISNVARLLSDNKFLDGYSVELVPWEQYRPYARVNGTLTRAVHIPSQKKIIISDAYWGKNETLKSDEALAAVILHELLHPSLNPILAVGQKLALGQEVETDAKTKEVASSLMSSMEKLMPYLKERSAGDLKLQYGLTSIDEFFSVFASDPYFRDFLSRTPLPKSMQKTGVMQTILDFIYRILAKLNFATAQTDSALDYATEQLGELIEASQSMSHALDANGDPMQPSLFDDDDTPSISREDQFYGGLENMLLDESVPVDIKSGSGVIAKANTPLSKELLRKMAQAADSTGDGIYGSDLYIPPSPTWQRVSQMIQAVPRDQGSAIDPALQLGGVSAGNPAFLMLAKKPVKYETDIVDYDSNGNNVATGGYSAVEVLEEISRSGSKVNKSIARRLLALRTISKASSHASTLSKIRVGYIDQDSSKLYGKYTFNQYAEGGGVLLSRRATEDTIIHELMHGLTAVASHDYTKVNGEPVFENKHMQKLYDLWNKLEDAYYGNGRHKDNNYTLAATGNTGFTTDQELEFVKQSVFQFDEFIANIYSEPALQRWLSSIPSDNPKKSFFREILDIISDLLGLEVSGSMLEESFSYMDSFVQSHSRSSADREVVIQGSALDSEYQDSLSSEERKHLGKGYDKNKILYYDEILDEISRGSTQEQQEIIRTINVSRTGQGLRDGSMGLQKTTTLASDEERRDRLGQLAKESGQIISRSEFDAELDWGQVLSGEHKVYFNEDKQRFFKEYPATSRVDFDKYLERLLLHNYLFPEVAYKFEGLIPVNEGRLGYSNGFNIVVSQPTFGDKRPSPQMVNDAMLSRGFRLSKSPGFFNITGPGLNPFPVESEMVDTSSGFRRVEFGGYQRGDLIVRDLGPKNSRSLDGRVMLFDPIIEQGLKPQIGRLMEVLNEIEDKRENGYKGLSPAQVKLQLEIVQQEIVDTKARVTGGGNQGSALDAEEFDESITANPDENMRVMMESNAAGFNEMVTELVKVYQQIGGEELGMDLETFLDQFGSPSSTNISTIKKRLEKDLSPFMDSIEDVRLDNAGLNRIAFNWGRRKGVANLESVRTKARKELQNRILAEEMSEKAIIASMRTYEDLEKGRFPPIEKQIESILTKANQVKFDTLVEYVTSLPNASLTQADIRAAQELSKADIEQVMELLIEVPGEAETLKKVELMDQIKGLGIPSLSGDNKTHAVKRMAIMRAIRESKGQMALYRLSKGKIGGDQKAMLKVGRQIASAPDLKTLGNIVIQPGVKGTPFRHFADLKEAELIERENLEDIKKEQEIYSKIDLGIKARSDVLRASLGELQPVSIHDGASILTMEWDDKNAQWKRGENFKVQIRNGKLVDRAQFVKVNRETLRFINDPESKKEFGEEPWFDLMREQALLAMAEPIGEEYFHVQRASWISGLQGLTERFAKMGYDGMKLSQMSSQTVALFRDYSSKSQALSLQFNASAQRLMGALKVGGREFYSGIYQDIWWWFDNHPEFAGNEEQAFAELWKYLRKGANIPDRTLLNDNARRLTKDLVAKTLSARDFEKSVNLQLGNRIKDDEFKVQSYIDGELVDFYRDPMDIGYATMPRSINNGVVIDTNVMMQRLGWRGEAGNELIAEAQSAKDLDTMSKIYNRMFTEEVVEKFLKPFLHSDVRQSTFRGPSDADGHNAYLGNTFIRESFRASGGDVQKMTDIIFDRVSIDTTLEARLIWKYYFLRQVDNKYRELKKVADKLESDKVEQGLNDSHLMRNTPQSLDSRMMESRLPKEFFYYTMYDEVTSSIRLALQVATKTFGRQGDKAQRAFKGGRATFERARSTFNALMDKATNGKHDSEPWKHYSRADKKEAYRLLRKDGDSNPEKTWNELYSKSVALGEMNRAMEHLARYYGKDNAAGPYKDANLLLELLGVQALSVLNNPKSSFWQNLGLFEFPMAFRGLNKMAGKGTAAALGNFVNQTFGGMVESMGVELDKTGRYAQYLNNTHFRLDEMDLDFKTYVGAQLGSGGELSGHEPRKYLRMAKRAMMFNKRKNVDGTRAPFDWLTVLKGIFPYTNNVVNHSIGVGAIHAYNDLILQASEEIQRRGITEYNGELSAQDLGMGDKLGETFIGEADGYRRMNELLISHGLPSVTRMAFDFIDRKKIDKNAFPIERNAALLINTIAMDQISGDGFNAKPAWLYSNEYLRYFNTFLGWPLGKMGRDLTAVIRDGEDPTTTYIALMKYIGLLTAVYMPMSLSFGMMIDWYDEEMLEKPNNLPPITPWAALPIVGIPIAATDPNFTIYSVTSRIAKAGVPFGMGTELLNGIFSKGDPYGASRELSLDSRIFMFSMFKNIYDAMGTWIHQGEWDWETVGRPIAYGVGGNSVIQMMDLATAQFDIDNEERRVADYIGLKNTIKKSAFMMGLELRPPFKGGGRPTGVSVNTRQMARAAYAGDSQEFLLQYQQALEAAREDGREDPERAVIDSYKTRSLRHGITKTKMTDAEWNRVMSVLDDEDRMRVMQAVSAHEHYLRLMGGSRRPKSIKRTIDVNRALAASLLIQ